jgi:hypothetical protein
LETGFQQKLRILKHRGVSTRLLPATKAELLMVNRVAEDCSRSNREHRQPRVAGHRSAIVVVSSLGITSV